MEGAESDGRLPVRVGRIFFMGMRQYPAGSIIRSRNNQGTTGLWWFNRGDHILTETSVYLYFMTVI
ncbi:MAG TPA: hypothetical protein PLV88_05180, partial [Methanoregulaceae archaeon]|nr:hypothetical protein [Methanoregulaceae archaeon]